MQARSQFLISLAGLAAVLLIGEHASVALARSSLQTDCAAITATVPAAYWFYHALVLSHPAMVDPGDAQPLYPDRKALRT